LSGQHYYPSALPTRYPLSTGLGKPWTLHTADFKD